LKLTINKSISARRLSPKDGVPYSEPESNIPFGAVLTYKGPDRDAEKFMYLEVLYRCPRDVLASALDGGKIPSEEDGAGNGAATANTVTAAAPPPEAKPAPETKLKFETLAAGPYSVARAKVPGGWLIVSGASSPTFYPDPKHDWDGESV
jgi:hypothetical protein